MSDKKTKDLEIMLADPKRAVRSMSIPLFLGMLVTMVQVFIDTFWCTGLGSESMASITVSGPVYWIISNVGVGLGVGVTTAVARALGANNRDRANSLSAQILMTSFFIAVLLSIVTTVISKPLLTFMTGSDDIGLSMSYVQPFVLFSLPLVLNGILSGMLRGEGAARKVSLIALISCLTNIVLDPLFIYGLGWGVRGASVATCLTFCCTTCVMLYWYFADRMYVRPRFRNFRFDRELLWDIFVVGIPQTVQMILTPLMIAPQNAIVMNTGGDVGLLATTIPFQFISLAMIPAGAFSSASISVASAAMGQHDFMKVESCFNYALRVSLFTSFILAVVLFLFAEPLVGIFTTSGDMVQHQDEFAKVLRIYSCTTILNSILRQSSARMQTMKYAHLSTILMFLRECLFISFYWVASFWGMDAIYWALVLVNLTSAVMLYSAARYVTKKRRLEYSAAS